MNILIVEDDELLVFQIKSTFNKYGFVNRIHHIPSYKQYILSAPRISSYDLILLDINLWNEWRQKWFFLLSKIREHNKCIPIIMISSHSEYSFLEKAFALWAHDYMVKPFRNRELQIRIQRWFRNFIFSEYFSINNILNYDILRYDISAYEFYVWDKKIILSKSNKYLLSLLVIYREKVLLHDFLIDKIWWFSEDTHTKNLRIKIMRLKNRLKPFGLDTWIHTVRWDWYILKNNKH